jgi:outer membrane lipoprotein carrier protein
MAAVKFWFRVAIEFTVCAAMAGWVMAAEPVSRVFADDRAVLAERLQSTAVYTATFTQSVFGVRGELLERSAGRVWLQRPRFKWVVDDPYPQTLLIDGHDLKLYDPDLEQLTVRPLEEALKDTPVALLTSETVVLSDDFRILRIGDADGDSFVVEPTGDETLYREILLHFDANGLSGLDILDHLGQRTEVRFTVDPGEPVIDDAAFTLDVPPGTDVIGG